MKEILGNASVYQMSGDNPPAARVPDGSTLVFETLDCFGGQVTDEAQGIESLDWERINPATGPVWVEGAEPGDALRVEIHRIELADRGAMAAIPDAGIFGDRVERSSVKILPIQDGFVDFAPGIRLAARPMIGVIGVAPAQGSVPCGTPGSHGGNMDNTRIGEGAVLYFPVFHPGALLAMGDVHACMGDGEIMVTGVETAARVTVSVKVVKGLRLRNPALETGDRIYSIASHAQLSQAIRCAAEDLLELAMERLGMDLNQAGMLLSACGNAEVCQIVDPLSTARFSMPKGILGGWEG